MTAAPAPAGCAESLQCALIVFAREAIPGTVKTRLAARIGSPAALRVYRRLLTRTLRLAHRYRERRGVSVILAGEGALGQSALERRALRHGFRWQRQHGDDLGARMLDAFERAFAAGFDRVVLIGCDCPVLGARELDQAFSALAQATAAFAPAEDGGYVLVALTRPVAALFAGIRWGADTVFAQTREAAQRDGIRLAVLPELWDVDLPADVLRWEQHLRVRSLRSKG